MLIYLRTRNLEIIEITEIKLEVFATVDFENNVLESRKDIIENLGKQNEVEEVIKVFVDKSETFIDVDNVRWNNVDIFFKTKEKTDTWNNSKFKR